jgi:hypothetical protein
MNKVTILLTAGVLLAILPTASAAPSDALPDWCPPPQGDLFWGIYCNTMIAVDEYQVDVDDILDWPVFDTTAWFLGCAVDDHFDNCPPPPGNVTLPLI